jgi:glycosyltransferase involved in cell wall biosynthesis
MGSREHSISQPPLNRTKSTSSKTSPFKRIGFISTRIAGTDGVSLEIEKWANVLERNGCDCFYFAGECDRPSEKSFLVDEAFFGHPEIEKTTAACFGCYRRPLEITSKVQELKDYFKEQLYQFIDRFGIEVVIPENVLAIPLNIPLGLALTEFISETLFPTIAHHHDFYWERDRFLVNCAQSYLDCAFPPELHSVSHVVINSLAAEQLSHRRGISNTLIPNVYDYASPPEPPDEYAADLRARIGLEEDDLLILQPTRIVPRKWIERAIEIVSLLELPNPVLVVSHASGDEDTLYFPRIMEMAERWNVEIRAIDHLVNSFRATGPNGNKIYSIGDIYQAADLVLYPSGYEGFGNAFLEAVYYRKPIVVNRYSIYVADIEPKGFDVIPFDGFATKQTIHQIQNILEDDERREEKVNKNYELARRFYSYEVLEEGLLHLLFQLSQQETRFNSWGKIGKP